MESIQATPYLNPSITSTFTSFHSCSTLSSPILLNNLLSLDFTLTQIGSCTVTLENVFNFEIKPFMQTDSFGSPETPALNKSLFKVYCCLNELKSLKNLISNCSIWLSNVIIQSPFYFRKLSLNVCCVAKCFSRKPLNGSLNNKTSSGSKCSFQAIKDQRDGKMHLR